jgi:ABC-type phosphate transport system auxiliary subunit
MPATFRNNLVFANNKRQNIESRLFATGSGFRTGSVAISYNSFFNKFISDLPTLSNRVSPKYYASESIAASSTNNLIYQNNRTIYLQNFDIFVQETVSNTRQSETGSFSTLLKTKYYTSESVAASSTNNLIYQNNRSIYLQNLDVFIQETVSNTRQNETGSFSTLLKTKYYASESVAASSTNNLVYQNNRSIYLQNFDIFVQETVSNTRQSETSSFSTLLKTKYYASESIAASSTNNLIYQNNRSIYLQNFDILTQETVSNTRQNETGSFSTLLKTKYYASESVADSSTNNLVYQNNRTIYLQNFDIFVQETPVSSSTPVVIQNETGSIATILNTKYTLADAVSVSAAQIGYQSDRAIYLENNDILIKETVTSLSTNDTGSNNLLLFTNYYMSQSNATGSTLAYQNFKYIYLEDDSYLLTE